MCGRYGLTAQAEDFVDIFPEFKEKKLDITPRYNIKPTQTIPVIYKDTYGHYQFDLQKWGFHPPWLKSILINTRMETAFTSRFWQSAMEQRRCLIPASYFYEWQDTGGKNTQPWKIGLKKQKLFFMAGIWANEKGKQGEDLHTCSILTTAANDTMKNIHNRGPHKFRQPVIIEPISFSTWFDLATARDVLNELMYSMDSDKMETWRLTSIGDDALHTPPAIM